jgi:hypothetical protein
MKSPQFHPILKWIERFSLNYIFSSKSFPADGSMAFVTGNQVYGQYIDV